MVYMIRRGMSMVYVHPDAAATTQRVEERTGVYLHTNGNMAGIWISVVDAVGPVKPCYTGFCRWK
jgi:hypothetical protein